MNYLSKYPHVVVTRVPASKGLGYEHLQWLYDAFGENSVLDWELVGSIGPNWCFYFKHPEQAMRFKLVWGNMLHFFRRNKALHVFDHCTPKYKTWKNGYTQSIERWELNEEVLTWLHQRNIKYEFSNWIKKMPGSAPIIFFENKDDEMLFKLTWM